MKGVSVLLLGILRILQSFFNKKASRHMDSTEKYLIFGLYFESVASIFALVYLFVSGVGGFNCLTVICAAISGAAFFIELMTALRALKRAPLALCTMCSLGGNVILPTILGIYFFNEPVTVFRGIGIVFFFLSAYFLMPSENKKITMDKSTILILTVNFLINGLCGFMGKYFAVRVQNGNSALFACLSYAFAAAFFCVAIAFNKKAVFKTQKKIFPKDFFVTGGALGIVCTTIVYFSAELSRIIEIAVLNTVPNAVCLVGSLVLGVTLFKEKLTARKTVGVTLNILSTTAIVLF